MIPCSVPVIWRTTRFDSLLIRINSDVASELLYYVIVRTSNPNLDYVFIPIKNDGSIQTDRRTSGITYV